MQATVRGKGFGFDHIKVVLVAAGVLATTIAGTAAIRLTNDTADSTVAGISAPATAQQPAWRFAEINQLPVTGVAAVGYNNMRFAEMNELPVSGVAWVNYADLRFAEINQLPVAAAVQTTYAGIRFLEINALPEASVAAPAGHDGYRFLEINQLPGDALIAPEMNSGTAS